MGSRLSPGQLAELCDTVLAGDLSRGVAAPEVVTALYRLLAFAERPVTAARLAAATGCTAIEEVLRRLPNIERDEHGTVVGFGGLTRRPTQRQLDIAGRCAHAWCAWDTLFLSVALDTTVAVRSHCPAPASRSA